MHEARRFTTLLPKWPSVVLLQLPTFSVPIFHPHTHHTTWLRLVATPRFDIHAVGDTPVLREQVSWPSRYPKNKLQNSPDVWSPYSINHTTLHINFKNFGGKPRPCGGGARLWRIFWFPAPKKAKFAAIDTPSVWNHLNVSLNSETSKRTEVVSFILSCLLFEMCFRYTCEWNAFNKRQLTYLLTYLLV